MKATRTSMLLAMMAAALLSACDRPQSQETAAPEKEHTPPAVTQTAELAAVTSAQRLAGVAMVLNPDPLLQIDADLTAIKISSDFSRATAGRYKSTGSLSRQIIENAERQAGTDGTQQALLESRLRQTWGDQAPFLTPEQRKPLIVSLSAGTDALVRIDFPDIGLGAPQNVRVAPLAGGTTVAVKMLWPAPTGNLAMPGVSYFALIATAPGLRPGDRAHATADGQEATAGVEIPSAAVVIFAGQSWCYIETAPGTYERKLVTLDHPTTDGFLAKTGFAPGQRVVVRGASMLLSREAGPGDGDDDDDGPKKPRAKPAPAAPQDSDDKPWTRPAPTAGTALPAPASGSAEAREAPKPATPTAANTSAAADDDDERPGTKPSRAVKPGDGPKPPVDRD